MVFFISYLGRAQLLLPPAILEYLSTGDELQLLGLGPIYLLPQIPLGRREPEEIFIRRKKGGGLSSVASLYWYGARTPYLVGSQSSLPVSLRGPG